MEGDDSRTERDRLLSTDRRRLLGALGAGAIAATAGCTGGGDGDDGATTTDGGGGGGTAANGQASIHPSFGYAGTGEDPVPDELSPDHTVGLHTDETKFVTRNERPVGARFGTFYFDPVGLHVDPGDVVNFELATPDHTVTAIHPGFGRQQRVPDGVPWFSSPVVGPGGFWLYRFDEPGVYDLICAPHELFGMAMRVVVGDVSEPVVRGQGRPPELLSGALLGTGVPGENGTPDLGVDPLAPENVMQSGRVPIDDVSIDLAIPIPRPTHPSEIGATR